MFEGLRTALQSHILGEGETVPKIHQTRFERVFFRLEFGGEMEPGPSLAVQERRDFEEFVHAETLPARSVLPPEIEARMAALEAQYRQTNATLSRQEITLQSMRLQFEAFPALIEGLRKAVAEFAAHQALAADHRRNGA